MNRAGTTGEPNAASCFGNICIMTPSLRSKISQTDLQDGFAVFHTQLNQKIIQTKKYRTQMKII